MNNAINILEKLTQIETDKIPNSDEISTLVHDQDLHTMVANLFNQVSDKDIDFKKKIDSIRHSPGLDSNPEKLAQLQVTLGEYTNYVSLVNTLARKSVATIETLEKAQ